MAKYHLSMLLFRLVLPAGLLISIGLRPYGLSMIYLLLYLIAPFPQIPRGSKTGGSCTAFLIATSTISLLLALVHVAWHAALFAHGGSYGAIIQEYPIIADVGSHLGLIYFLGSAPWDIVLSILPELIMIMTSVVVTIAVRKLLGSQSAAELRRHGSNHQQHPALTNAGKYLALFLIMFSGIILPSVTSGIYYLVFMGAATAWALGCPLEKGFSVVCKCVMALMAIHVAVILIYQSPWIIEFYPADQDFSRYFGLSQLVSVNVTTFHYDAIDQENWRPVVSPLVILVTYFFLAIESRELFKPKPRKKFALTGLEDGKSGSISLISFRRLDRSRSTSGTQAKDKWMTAHKKVRVTFEYIDSYPLRREPTETDPLVNNMNPARNWSALRFGSSKRSFQDPSGSVVMSDNASWQGHEPTLRDEILAAIIDFFQVIIRSSYIATTITMMAWSILFHSWLAFVFLMWACVVWLRQDQRSFMLHTSPLLVLYAELLLLAQYIYTMDLTESELPNNIAGHGVNQIGLTDTKENGFVALLIKSLFTCMFWVTLRQWVEDRRKRRQSAVVADMAAPLQLTVSAAASGIEAKQEEVAKSRLMRTLGKGLRALCARYWIYIVVIMLFVIGITGERMTIFRIIYMFLFLSFILIFQISWYWWRRFMYMFWIVLIIYSMINLILLYVYQFNEFSDNIEQYLFVNKRLQHDLGLDTYPPADLFIKLLTPTCFLIITIMQVHYFHKDFLALSDLRTRSNSKAEPGASTNRDDVTTLPSENDRAQTPTEADHSFPSTNFDERSRRSTKEGGSQINIQRSRSNTQRSNRPSVSEHQSRLTSMGYAELATNLYHRARVLISGWMDLVFVFLYLHLTKIILVTLMFMCVMNVCALHVPIIFVIVPATLMYSHKQRIIILFTSVLISLYLMANMVYQIDYIQHSDFTVNCTENTTYNNAEWFGFYKTSPDVTLASMLRAYIGLIVLFTFNSLITYRQRIRKQQQGGHKEKVLFPEIRREDADKDLISCIKYLFNYGFYKFGIEVCLMCLIGVIGSRMDFFAVIYSLWLVVLVSLNREKLARIWLPFTLFVMVLIPIQYLMAVGFLPQICMPFPWSGDSEQMKHVRNWFFLPYNDEPPHASKLVFDFFLLVFSARQIIVFNIEKRIGDSYHGGSNSEDIGQDWETPEFVNPIPDFLSKVNTWLDVIKRLVFLGMLWLTLAMMFLTGANRVNIFSMGYLIGSFMFLWQGTDFYLRPKPTILKWWSWLVLYNVMVVIIKTLLQVPGCIFSHFMQTHCCWLVQLLGIGCVDKFAGGNIAGFIKMNYIKAATCPVPQESIGLAWDGVCFAFLILQRRLFHSYYFFRVIDESKATTILASRGAELIEELRQKQMKVQDEQEEKILEKIKIKMERIKASQKKIHGDSTKEPKNHDIGKGNVRRRRDFKKRHEGSRKCKPPSSHTQAVRSGDYYMFDEFDDTEVQLRDYDSSSEEEGPKEMGIGEFLGAAYTTDLQKAVLMRRASAPAARMKRLGSLPASTHTDMPRRHSRAEYRRDRPTDTDDVDVIMEQRPLSDLSSEDEQDDDMPPEQETLLAKLQRILETAWAFIASFLVTLTRYLIKYSRDYRYVSRMLSIEKRLLKEKEGFGIGLRQGKYKIWAPLPESLVLSHPSEELADFSDNHLHVPAVDVGRKLSDISVPEIRILAPSMERGLDASPLSVRKAPPPSPPASQSLTSDDDDTSEHESMFSLQTSASKDVSALEEQDESILRRDHNPILYVAYALWYAILAHTDIVCFIMVFINQIQSATILSIPLPLMVFLWGTLSIPRPTKTFWVTLIAYTEVIVLIKTMFQFEILPWNQKAIPANMPFTAPRIIGIERKKSYATYDLLLLLIIFLHRFMLKSLGLWKETTTDFEIPEDAEYALTADDTNRLVRGETEEVGLKYVQLHTEAATTIVTGEDETAKPSTPRPSEEVPGPSTDLENAFDVNDDKEPIIAVTTTMEEPCDNYPHIMVLSAKRYLQPLRSFFEHMLAPGARVTADVYAYMFLCDFVNFMVVIFGFAAFGTHQGDGGVQTYLEENKVPIPFLVMLILQFALIVIDRALYLRKYMLGKILFQYALIVGVHVWMFFVLPFITERTFNSLLPPPMWYMVKCIYLLLSAYQIRCGYPRRIIGNFLCNSYRLLNMLCFKGFMVVPFVFELRTLMDWIWTDTSMSLMDWLKMEDIFASVFLLKCSRVMEDRFPQPRGSKKSNMSKYLLGGGVLAFVIAIIWFPLVIFALGNTVGEPNPPTDVTVKIRMGPFLPVYQMSAQSHNIEVYSEQDYNQLSNLYVRDRTAQTFLSNYIYNDVAVVTINPNSTNTWDISPPELQRLENEAISNATLMVKFTYIITHPTNSPQNAPTIETSREVPLPAYINNTKNIERTNLMNMLAGTASANTWLHIRTLFPKFVKVFNKGITKPAYQLMPPVPDELGEDAKLYRDVHLRLEREGGTMYWRVKEACPAQDSLLSIPLNNCDMLVMYTFNDKIFPETLNFISGGGIIGLYTTFVFLASRVLRGFFSGIYTKIMFDDLPNVDRVLQLCLDIYLVREALELSLEEDLFAKLVFLYRSPETMIKWSRPKEEEEQRALPPS